jgi:hypothetical protein
MNDLAVIGVTYDGMQSLCFRCVATHYHEYPDSDKRQPLTTLEHPTGFKCDSCYDMIKPCPVYPTMVVTNTGIMRNGDIEFVVELTDEETGMTTMYTGYGLDNILPEEWGGTPFYDPYLNKTGSEYDHDEDPF